MENGNVSVEVITAVTGITGRVILKFICPVCGGTSRGIVRNNESDVDVTNCGKCSSLLVVTLSATICEAIE